MIEEGCKPKSCPPHRIALSMIERLKALLSKHEKNKIVKEVEELTPDMVVNNLVIAEKPGGDIRICLDPTGLNKVLKRNMYQIKGFEEIMVKMSGKSWFSVMDLKDGFYHIELDQASANKCCFSTTFGVYQFLRMPFGVSIYQIV